MRVRALFCPGCAAPVATTSEELLSCSYCGSTLSIERTSIQQNEPRSVPGDKPLLCPLVARLENDVNGRFELSLLDQPVPEAGPEWFKPLDLGAGHFALVYLRLVDQAGSSLDRCPDSAFQVLAESLREDSDPGLGAFLLLEHLVEQGFRDKVEVAVLLFEPERSSVLVYNAGCRGCILWVSQEEGRTIDLGRAYDALEPKMLRETRDHFSNLPRRFMAAEDLVVLVSAGYAGRGGGPYSSGLGGLLRSLNENLGEHPLQVVTKAKNAFWGQRPPAAQETMPRSHVRVAAVRVLPVSPAQELPPEPSLQVIQSSQYEVALLSQLGDFLKLMPLHDDRAALVWLSLPGSPISEQVGEIACEAIGAVLDRPNHGDNENPRRAGREALEKLELQDLRLLVVLFLHRHGRVKYFRQGWHQPLSLGPRGLSGAEGMQQFDEGGEATVRPGRRLLFPGGLPYKTEVQKVEELCQHWKGGKSSALYQSLAAHWRKRKSESAARSIARGTLGDGATPAQLVGLALLTNTARE